MRHGSALLLFQLLLWPGMLVADEADALSHEQARQLVAQGTILPLEHILHQVEGHVLEVELEYHAPLFLYGIEILDDAGNLRWLHFNAATGTILSNADED